VRNTALNCSTTACSMSPAGIRMSAHRLTVPLLTYWQM
jgi:hypothetical protein